MALPVIHSLHVKKHARNQLHQYQLTFVDRRHVVQIVSAMKSMELQFAHVKRITLALHQIVDQNVPLTLNVHTIKRAINLNAKILVMELVELMQVCFNNINN